MKGYKAAKTASKVTVSKTDDKYSMVKKNYDKDIGTELSDTTLNIDITNLTNRISYLTSRIAELTSEKEDYEQLKTDLEAL
tara:strand:- start:1178 stop:1420 length:243 start_codon:yes stop_codon:yes gene_type:complete